MTRDGADAEALQARGSLPGRADRQQVRDPDFAPEPRERDPRWRVIGGACRSATNDRAQNIVAWVNVVPWADQRQVEQDLIISRALVLR